MRGEALGGLRAEEGFGLPPPAAARRRRPVDRRPHSGHCGALRTEKRLRARRPRLRGGGGLSRAAPARAGSTSRPRTPATLPRRPTGRLRCHLVVHRMVRVEPRCRRIRPLEPGRRRSLLLPLRCHGEPTGRRKPHGRQGGRDEPTLARELATESTQLSKRACHARTWPHWAVGSY